MTKKSYNRMNRDYVAKMMGLKPGQLPSDKKPSTLSTEDKNRIDSDLSNKSSGISISKKIDKKFDTGLGVKNGR